MLREEIVKAIEAERAYQDSLWGEQQNHSLPVWMTILTEEVGELAQEVLRVHFAKKPPESLVEEAIQVAAVVFALLEQSEEITQLTQGKDEIE